MWWHSSCYVDVRYVGAALIISGDGGGSGSGGGSGGSSGISGLAGSWVPSAKTAQVLIARTSSPKR
jgi:hypothetical protein